MEITSFLAKGAFIELICAQNVWTQDDAFLQGVRNEINGKPPFEGKYARQAGIFQIATRRKTHETDEVLYRHTGPKKENGKIATDAWGRQIFFPRSYILRLVSDKEKAMSPEDWITYRRRVLSTVAYLLKTHEEEGNEKAQQESGSPRRFSPTKFTVPDPGWDKTPQEPLPLDWYITDNMIVTVIQSVYVETDFGRWDMFSEKAKREADCYFSPPYSDHAAIFGFRNPDESSVWHPRKKVEGKEQEEEETKPAPAVDQGFNSEDVLPLD